MARLFWPGGDVLGARFRLDDEDPWTTIVGVVGDVRHAGLDVDPDPEFYTHRLQLAADFGAVVVRAKDGSTDTAASALRAAVHEVDPNLPLASIASMRERIERTIGRRRLTATIVGAFGATALALSAIGIYGVVSYTVAQRTREIGVRMALGSGRGRIVRIVLRQGSTQIAAGLLVGALVAAPLAWLLRIFLLDVPPFDPIVFTVVPGVLVAAGWLGCLLPALRATRVDPQVALGSE
jgi:ABC-type antimicrobial peptide transport system permease subunit